LSTGSLRLRGDMNKSNPTPVSLVFPIPSFGDLESASRLIVLVPEETDHAVMTRRVWELAHASGCQILFLSLCVDEAQESSLYRQLITMAAMVQDGKVYAEARVEIGSNWVNVLRAHLQDGDMIVCPAEQRAGLFQRPLSQILQSNLKAPVYILSNLYSQKPSQSNWYSQVMAWSGSLGVLIGAFLLQIRIVSMPADWAQTALLILSVIGEIWLIGIWNSLFG